MLPASASILLANLIAPVNLALALLVVAIAFSLFSWHKIAKAALALAVIWPLLWSLPLTSLWLGGYLEQQYPYKNPTALPQAEAIVVLGGHTANSRRNWFADYDAGQIVLRTDTANALYKAARAPQIIVSGAALDGGVSEATIMANALERAGVNSKDIIAEKRSLTTRENALYTAELLQQKGIQNFLLVSSALHMPRAMASFQGLGLHPTAAGSPPQITIPEGTDYWFWLPSMRALYASKTIIKEYLALFVYKLRGWL